MPWTKLRYHLVFSTKYRRPCLKEEYDAFLYGRLGQITKRIGGYPFAVNGWHDHVHLLCALPPNKTLSECVAKLKSQSSGALRLIHANPADLPVARRSPQSADPQLQASSPSYRKAKPQSLVPRA